MSQQSFSYGVGGPYTVPIPGNAAGLQIYLRGSRGGSGGNDSGVGGSPGNGAQQYFSVYGDLIAGRNFTIFVGAQGSNGSGYSGNAPGGNGGSGYGAGNGGRGGNAGDPPYSGGGGGGGGATLVQINGQNCACIGGSGGAGGGSDDRNGANSANGYGAAGGGGFGMGGGGNGGDPGGTDGGGGGGGGGGSPGGGGGGGGVDKQYGGGAGAPGGSRYNSGLCTPLTVSSQSGSGNGNVVVAWTLIYPSISSFYAIPSVQTSSNGIPQYSTTIYWVTSGTTGVILQDNAGLYTAQGVQGSYTVNNLPQSTVGSNSPANRNFTLTAYNPGANTTSTITVSAYNDNVPSNSWTTSFTNLEPNTTVDLSLGTLQGVDMPCSISTSGAGNFMKRSGGVAGTQNYNNGENVVLRTNTLYFNTDISGQTGMYGKTNSKTVTVTTPGGSFNVTVTTRPPVIQEEFDFVGSEDTYPYEDIDLINNSPNEFVTTDIEVMNDIELNQSDNAITVRSDNADVQVSINGGDWQDVTPM